MKRFLIVFGQEFKETLRSKPFIIISVFLALVLVVAAVIGVLSLNDSHDDGAMIPDGSAVVDYTEGGAANAENSYDYIVAFDNRSGNEALAARLRAMLPFVRFDDTVLDTEDEELTAINAMLENGSVDSCVVLYDEKHFDVYENTSMYSSSDVYYFVLDALNEMAQLDEFAALGVSESDAAAVLNRASDVYGGQFAVGGYGIGKFIYNYLMIILMFLIIGLYGQMVSTRVATEKSSRTMEVLATSVSPGELLCGKVLGVGAAGLLQMAVFLFGGFGIIRGLALRSPILSLIASELTAISATDIVCLCLYFLLGFLLYAFIFGGLGSMVSQVEDLSGTASLPLYIFMIGYFLSIVSSSSGMVGPFMKAASFIPFWSPIVMFSRMTIETVPAFELAISLAILAATGLLAAWFSVRLYRTGMLRYGKPPKLKEIINAIKSK